MHRNLILLLIPIVLLAVQCMPYQEEKITEINFTLNDPVVQKVLTHQDLQLTDSLCPYFRHIDPTYRYAAAMAFASHRDPAALDSLLVLLNDEVDEVKEAAAFAIGQLGVEAAGEPLIEAFRNQDSLMENSYFSRAALEAIGKCASPRYLPLLSAVRYVRMDTLLLEGQALGVYRYALRGETAPEGTKLMVDLLARIGYSNTVRFIAANYLSRSQGIRLDSFANSLSRVFRQEDDPRIRMALAIAIGKTRQPQALEALKTQFAEESDYRVRCNILRALGNFAYPEVQPLVVAALKDKEQAVALSAAQFFLNHGDRKDGVAYRQLARDTNLHWQVQTQLLAAANRHTPPYFEATVGGINAALRRQLIDPASNDYQKAATLKAMAEFPWNYRYVHDQGYIAQVPIIRSASVEALASIARRPDFDAYFGLSRRRVKRDLTNYMVEAINNGDLGMMAIAAGVLRDNTLGFKELIDSTDFLVNAQRKLSLPKDLETYNEVQKTIDFFAGREVKNPLPPEPKKSFEWRMVQTVTAKTQARVETNKGTIVLRLMPDQAPGSVANFVTLSRQGFYDNKKFHRVVPNFVIQTGCPRGDGYGSLDYTIRSELSTMSYNRKGLVGMASAGNHTECTQWFITHSPTLHLDGNYTIFAEVIEGMDVVDKIVPGDVISRVAIE
ncbi:MAG: peptidylprolyl isomerase [Bacteroidota bacterium]